MDERAHLAWKKRVRESSEPIRGAKVEKILRAARQLFIKHGFSATNMSAVADLAGVGKATVYAHFKSKDVLFTAVIAYEGKEHTVSLIARRNDDFSTVLSRFAYDAFDLLLSPTSIAAFRTTAAEAVRSPDLGRLFYEAGPVKIVELLGKFLEEVMAKGEIRRADARLAATHFLGLICSDLQVRALLGQGAISKSERRKAVNEGLNCFLLAYQVKE